MYHNVIVLQSSLHRKAEPCIANYGSKPQPPDSAAWVANSLSHHVICVEPVFILPYIMDLMPSSNTARRQHAGHPTRPILSPSTRQTPRFCITRVLENENSLTPDLAYEHLPWFLSLVTRPLTVSTLGRHLPLPNFTTIPAIL